MHAWTGVDARVDQGPSTPEPGPVMPERGSEHAGTGARASLNWGLRQLSLASGRVA